MLAGGAEIQRAVSLATAARDGYWRDAYLALLADVGAGSVDVEQLIFGFATILDALCSIVMQDDPLAAARLLDLAALAADIDTIG